MDLEPNVGDVWIRKYASREQEELISNLWPDWAKIVVVAVEGKFITCSTTSGIVFTDYIDLFLADYEKL